MSDLPGHNIDLRPEQAPRWMQPLIKGVEHAHGHPDVQGVDVRGRGSTRADGQRAAVLILLEGADTFSRQRPFDASVLLTHRSPTMRSHSGQIAFPGGRMDPTDINPVDAALREAWEETGLDRTSVTPVAELDPVHIQASGYPVYPVLGHWHTPGRVGVASPAETDEVFLTPLADLIDPANRLTVGWAGWTGPAFTVNDYLVWGFTAGLLSALIHESGWEQEWDRGRTLDLHATLEKSRNNESHGPGVRFAR